MSADQYVYLVESLCQSVGLPDVDHVLEMRSIEVEGFDVRLDHFDTDEGAIYLNFDYGAVAAGRTLTVFRLMLEANLLIYAQDQAQLGLDVETGGIVLVVRVEMTDDLDGEMLADLLSHYAEHGRYWQKNIVESSDQMLDGIAAGEFVWLRA
ncbi:CesT family type III secretion system chaperone [Paraburkholderia sp. ZP32-5]|uniref:CesT family type III secretion system chaperone n=1 Tax=Paraburkholderia sp. ZP32-5 TaxID=2883245 RepID=UPI001F2C113F|nr:CesT family type III secretion system chaperone [Paraburkholderia sp. ZP32-5]